MKQRKLTDEQAFEIRRMCQIVRKRHKTPKGRLKRGVIPKLAAHFGLSTKAIKNLLARKTYRHVKIARRR